NKVLHFCSKLSGGELRRSLKNHKFFSSLEKRHDLVPLFHGRFKVHDNLTASLIVSFLDSSSECFTSGHSLVRWVNFFLTDNEKKIASISRVFSLISTGNISNRSSQGSAARAHGSLRNIGHRVSISLGKSTRSITISVA